MTNRERFLQEAVPFIFSSRDQRTVLMNSLACLKRYMDVEFIDFSYYVEGKDYIHRLQTVDKNVIVSNSYMEYVAVDSDFVNYDEVFILAEKFLHNKEKLPTLCPLEGNSCIALNVAVSDNISGCVSVKTYKEHAYNAYHKELMKGLSVPFSFAFAGFLLSKKTFSIGSPEKVKIETVVSPKSEIIGADSGLKAAVLQASEVAKYSSTVLIRGETGVGKELFADYIYKNSARKGRPFIKVNCGAMPESLIENELFGHEKGAFTGADTASKGRFELADRGTLFLDEVGELPMSVQAKLLRILQFGEVEKLGGSKTVKVDVRILAATNRDLKKMVQDGTFREDLFWRLNVFPIHIPPLRERREDIPELVEHLVAKTCSKLGIRNRPAISGSVMKRLVCCFWAGNVRELENVIEREIILNREDSLTFDSIKPCEEPEKTSNVNEESIVLDDAMKKHILKTLNQTNWRISGSKGAAYILGIHPNTLRHRMKKLGLL